MHLLWHIGLLSIDWTVVNGQFSNNVSGLGEWKIYPTVFQKSITNIIGKIEVVFFEGTISVNLNLGWNKVICRVKIVALINYVYNIIPAALNVWVLT